MNPIKGMPPPPSKPMSRETQTLWIVGAIVLMGLAVLYVLTRLPEGHPDKECQGVIFMDRACTANNAANRLVGY